ncbi:unnamed protein product [Phytomonas sp. EM1]|nr:unnamed protein product [Phytomonas sp. EM1]|eukprot:CCW61807.1 unnamed protein product [Phytomonas sp. isolate EM1]
MASVPPHHLDPSYVDYDHNYFRGSPPQLREYSLSLINRSHEEESLVFQLEQEIRAVQEERARYTYAKSQLDRERQRFETYKLDAQQQLDDERANLAALRAQDQREARKEVNSIDERYKSVTTLLSMERETNKRLHQENESLHAQLEELTSAMRESQAAHRAEVLRMRRDIDSLTRRNSELLAMAKEEQINNLVMPTPKTRPTTVVSKPTPPLTRNDNSENAPTTVPAEPPAKVVDTSIPIDNEDNGSTHSSGVPAKLVQHVVFDFTPQSSNTAARQRRAKAVEERLQRVEEERQRAREEAEEARMKQEKQAKEQINLLIKKQSERSERRPSQANSKPPEDALKERKAAEHPLRTPRVIGSAKNTTSAKPVVVPLKLKPHIPTKKELLQEVEPRPEEDYPDDEIITSTTQADSPNKREIAYRSGKKEIHYANGTVKVVLPSQHVILHFTNGDIKCTFPSGKSTYWYDTAQTSHTQLPSGVQLFEFCATGQSERHMPDGTKEILYPDGVYKIVHVDGSAETHLPDES